MFAVPSHGMFPIGFPFPWTSLDFTVALNMLDVFNKKQMYVSVMTGKKCF